MSTSRTHTQCQHPYPYPRSTSIPIPDFITQRQHPYRSPYPTQNKGTITHAKPSFPQNHPYQPPPRYTPTPVPRGHKPQQTINHPVAEICPHLHKSSGIRPPASPRFASATHPPARIPPIETNEPTRNGRKKSHRAGSTHAIAMPVPLRSSLSFLFRSSSSTTNAPKTRVQLINLKGPPRSDPVAWVQRLSPCVTITHWGARARASFPRFGVGKHTIC